MKKKKKMIMHVENNARVRPLQVETTQKTIWTRLSPRTTQGQKVKEAS